MNQTIADRIKEVRTILKMNQPDFGERINLSKTAIFYLEKGQRNATYRVIADICRVYNVSELWLKTGEGEMFVASQDDEINAFFRTYNITDELEISILRTFMQMDDKERAILSKYVRTAAEGARSKTTTELTSPQKLMNKPHDCVKEVSRDI